VLGVRAVSDDDDVADADLARRAAVHRLHPHATADQSVVAGEQLSLEDVDHRLQGGGHIQARRLAGLADVATRERPLGEDPAEHAGVVDDRHEVDARLSHLQPDRTDRVVATGGREVGAHHVAYAQLHVCQKLRQLGPTAVDQPLGLHICVTQADRLEYVCVIELVLQLGIADRRGDGVGVGVAVTADVDVRSRGQFVTISTIGQRRARHPLVTPKDTDALRQSARRAARAGHGAAMRRTGPARGAWSVRGHRGPSSRCSRSERPRHRSPS
jgi:hypothetical protein